MSEHGSGAGGRRRWWLIVIGVVVALVLGVGIGSALRSREGSPATQPKATATSTASSSGTPGTAVSQPLAVVAGKGGSRLAVDGLTPVGYPRSCAGAVAAATNYVSSAARLTWVGPRGDELLDQIADADSRRIEYYRQGQRGALGDGFVVEPHPEWGGFRLVACDSTDATVIIWPCELERLGAKVQRSCVAVSTAVAWVNGDWKLRRYEIPAEDEPMLTPDDPVLGADPLPAEQRRRALKAAGPDWQEYANAPR